MDKELDGSATKEELVEEEAELEEDVTDDDEGDDEDDDAEGEDDDESEEWESDEEGDDDNEGEGDDDDDNDEEIEDEVEAVLEASDSDGEGGDRCPICLNRFTDQDVGTPECCDHMFCLECIHEWSTNVNTCPSDRQVFKLILCRHGVDDVIYKKITVADVNKQKEEEEEEEEPTYCEVCHASDREDRLLLCDGCDLGYHLECLTPPLSEVPVEEWFCANCARREGEDADYLPHVSGYRRQIPRTLVMERVRSAIEERRVRRTRRMQQLASSDEEEGVESGDEPETEVAPPSAATSSSSPAKKSPVKKPTTKRKTPRKYKRRKGTTKRKTSTKKRSTTTKKKSTTRKRKTTRKGKTKKKGRKGKKTKRLARTAKPAPVTSVKTRIAGALGIINPPPGRTIPIQKTKQEKTLDMQKTDIGASSLSIFGHKDQINFYEDEQDEPGTSADTTSGSGGTRKYSRLALSSYKPIGRVPTLPTVKKKKKIVINTMPGASGGSLDLLGSIMQGQDKLQLSSKNLTIQRDGSITEKPGETPLKTSSNPSDTSPNSGSSLFKSSFTAVDKSTKQSSVLSSLKSESLERKPQIDEEYDPAFPTDEVDDDMDNGDEDKSKKDVEDEYDPAHPTDDISSDEDVADSAHCIAIGNDSQVKETAEKLGDNTIDTSENVQVKVETSKAQSEEVLPGKINSLTGKLSSKSEALSKLKDSAIFSDTEAEKSSAKSKEKSIEKKDSDDKTSPKTSLLNNKTTEKSCSMEKKESPTKKSPSIKITESNKKSSVKPFEISRKTLFEKRRLYGGEIDFSEDVDFSEGAFPETFELSVKRIEEVFKGTKNKVEPKVVEPVVSNEETEKLKKQNFEKEKTEKEKSQKEISEKEISEKDIKGKSDLGNLDKGNKESKLVQDDKVKIKNEKESKEKLKLTGKFKPISSNSEENKGTTKISVSDRFKKLRTERTSPDLSNLEEEDPIHEMRKLDKELDLEFGNADFSKKKEKDKENRRSKRKVSIDENDSENVRHRRESKENREKRKDTDYKYIYEEKEEGEVDDDLRLKDKKKREKKKRKMDRDKYYEEKGESDLDRRIVIQVSQNTDDRTVWEEEERQRKKRDREKRKRDKEKIREIEKEGKKDKKHKRLRSRSRSHDRKNRSRSKEKKRSRSRSRDREWSRDRSRRRHRDRSRSRSRDWSHERSRKKKKRNRSRDREREFSRDLSREREWSRDRDWSSERGRDRSRGQSRDRKRSREHSEDRVDIFGRSRSPFTRREFLKEKQNLTPRKKLRQEIEDDEDVIVLDSPPSVKKPTYDEVSSSESEKEVEEETKKIETISRIEVKNDSAREASASFVETDDKEEEFDSEPEETEQFQYTDRDEFLGQNKSKQMRQNLITIGVSGNDYDPANPTGTSSPAPPPLPEPISVPTPPLPPTGDFTQFPPPPPGPPPQGPPPGSVILQERPPMHVQASTPQGPGILGEGPIILQGPPPPMDSGPPSILQQRPAMSVPVNINVLPPGFHRGLPPTITSQRQLIVSPLRPGAPRLQRLASPGGVRFGWQVTTNSEVIPSQFGSRIPSPASLPGHPLINGPFDGLPPPHSEALPPHSLTPGHPQFPPPAVSLGEPPHMLALKTDTPPPNIVPIPVEMNDAPRHMPPPGPEPQLIHLGPDPRAPPPRLPIPLLPSVSEPPPMSVMVSMPPPNSSLMSIPPPADPFLRSATPPNSVSAILGLARMGSGSVPAVSSALIPGLSSSAALVNGDGLSNGNNLKTEGTLNELEKISELLNTQAHLMVLSKDGQNSSEKTGNNSDKTGVPVKVEDVFKVPQVPIGKSGTKPEVDATEVIDMDMGSPINEEGNIELPVSPQFDNLIDNPEDLLEEDFNKKMQKLHEKVEKEIVKPKDKTLTPSKNKDVKDMEKKDSPFKSKDEKRKHHSKENKHEKSAHKSRRHKPKSDKDLKEKAMKDAHFDLDSQEVPSSAVDMTIKEKYLKKLHLQERVVEEVKMAIKPFYSGKKINKDQYKDILRKAVPKICHSKSGNINPNKIKSLVEAYVEKYTKSNHSHGGETLLSPEVNGDSAKTKVTR